MIDRHLPRLTDGNRGRLIAAARTYLHVRWRHQGRSRAGVDCVGLLVAAFRDIGLQPQDAVGYGRIPYKRKLEEMLRVNLGTPIPKAEMRAGDIVLMKWKGDPSHVGLLSDYPLGGLALIHAFLQNKQVVEHRIDAEWASRIAEVYRP